MQEYITGRIKLADCDSSKVVKDVKSNDKNKELLFVLDENKDIIVEEVPPVYGVRCGSVVAGFRRPGSKKLHDVKWPSGKSKSCKLSELMRANKISKKDDTLVFQTECVYCTHLVKDIKKAFLLQIVPNQNQKLTARNLGLAPLYIFVPKRLRSTSDSTTDLHVCLEARK